MQFNTSLLPLKTRYVRRTSMATEAECYSAARIADRAMAEAFCTVLDAFVTARAIFKQKNDSTRGFLNEFKQQTGFSLSYVKKISQIAKVEGVVERVFAQHLGFSKAYEALEAYKEAIAAQEEAVTVELGQGALARLMDRAARQDRALAHWEVAKGIEALKIDPDWDFESALRENFEGMTKGQAERYYEIALRFPDEDDASANWEKVLTVAEDV